MAKINCEVTECSHNHKFECWANCVDIVGESAQESCQTSCSSYLNKLHYSELTNNTVSSGSCDCLQCSVKTCTYNENHLCSLGQIQVTGKNADYYTHTDCSSFKVRLM